MRPDCYMALWFGRQGDNCDCIALPPRLTDSVPERVETVVGDSTIVVDTDGSAGKTAELDRMLNVIRQLRPAGDSNAPATKAMSAAAVTSSALPAPAAAASTGTLTCNP